MKENRSSSDKSKNRARIAAVGTATPPCRITQELADEIITKHYSTVLRPRILETMHKVLAHPSVRSRYISVQSQDELTTLINEDPDRRVERFTYWALELAEQAIVKATQKVDIDISEITHLIVNTCTGYICPGLSTYLLERMALNSDIQCHDLVGSGCVGALPNIYLAENILRADPEAVVVCVPVEICSATYQMENDLSLIISNAIFGDGAGAAILWTRPQGLLLYSKKNILAPTYREEIRFSYKNGALHNKLSPRLPETVGEIVPGLIIDLLRDEGLVPEDIRHWAIHSGGDKVLNVIQEKLGLSHEQMAVTRRILSDYGNMSSATVLFELEQLVENSIKKDEWCVMTAFGAGLAAYAYLLHG